MDIPSSLDQKPVVMDELAQRLAAGPATFPHALDAARDLLLLVALDEDRITQASFLDQRVLTPNIWGRWVPFADVQTHLDPTARDDAHYMFHIGHVGSTLISRLLGEVPGVLSLREPLLLRDLADAKRDTIDAPWSPDSLPKRIQTVRRLLARTFRPAQRAVIKATSFTSEIAADLVTSQARALLLFVSPQSYMRTILAGENSRREIAALTGQRLIRLARHLDRMPFRLWSLSEGERIALGWITEMLSLQAAAAAMPTDASLWVDFDRFLSRPGETLLTIASHYALKLSAEDAETLVGGPIMHLYSKAPEHAYSPQLRHQLQEQAGRQYGDIIHQGMVWLNRLARDEDAVTRVITLTDRISGTR